MAESLGKDGANKIIFITANPRPDWEIPGVKKIIYNVNQFQDKLKTSSIKESSHINSSVKKILNTNFAGIAVVNILVNLKKQGFKPDLICGHSGWGTTLYIKDVFPKTPFLGYFEWYYNADGLNTNFDLKAPPDLKNRITLRNRNLPILSDLSACDHGFCPTLWQKSQFPKEFHHKINVMHDGIDTDFFHPDNSKKLKLPGLDLSKVKELVTYTARGFEPYRGFPQFIESLPYLLKNRPDVHVAIVGSDRVCYGKKLPDGQTYKQLMLETVDLNPINLNHHYNGTDTSTSIDNSSIDYKSSHNNNFNSNHNRVHFIDFLPYSQYLQLLQASSVHVYLTFPFVLSWSMLEAMSCECLVIGSNTPPVKEVIKDGVNGILVDFFSPKQIAEKITACLEYPSFMKSIKKKARKTVLQKYSLEKLLPKQLNLIKRLIEQKNKKQLNLTDKLTEENNKNQRFG